MRVCLYSLWQAASSCWTGHLSRCYQVTQAITPLPGPPGHTVYLSRFGRHQRQESSELWWQGCRLEFPFSLLHKVFTLCCNRDKCRGEDQFLSTICMEKKSLKLYLEENSEKYKYTNTYLLLPLKSVFHQIRVFNLTFLCCPIFYSYHNACRVYTTWTNIHRCIMV